MKMATNFCSANRLPKVTARPFSSRTSSCETERIASREGIPRGPPGGMGVEMGGREEVPTSDCIYWPYLTAEVILSSGYEIPHPNSRRDVGGTALWQIYNWFTKTTHQGCPPQSC